MSWLDKCVCGSHKKYPRKYPGDLYVREVEDWQHKNKRQHEEWLVAEAVREYWNGKDDG